MAEKPRKPLDWTPWSRRDLIAIDDYYALFGQQTAAHVLEAIFRAANDLERYPLAGTRGKWPGTRHKIIKSYPYTIVYRVKPKSMQVLRVLHQSRKYFSP